MTSALESYLRRELPARWRAGIDTLEAAAAAGDGGSALQLEALGGLDASLDVELEGPQPGRVRLRAQGRDLRIDADHHGDIAAMIALPSALGDRVVSALERAGTVAAGDLARAARRLLKPETLALLAQQSLACELVLHEVPEAGEARVRAALGASALSRPADVTVIARYPDLQGEVGTPVDLQRLLFEGKVQVLGDLGAVMQLVFAFTQ